MVDETLKEQVRLVEVTLSQTNELIKGVTTIGAGIRTAAITTWLGLLGFALQQRLPSLALLACFVVAAFFLVDAYHGQVYSKALARAAEAERLMNRYASLLATREDDPAVRYLLEGELRSFKLGCYSPLTRVGFFGLLYARPLIVFRVLYPAMLVVALLIGFLLQNAVSTPGPVDAPASNQTERTQPVAPSSSPVPAEPIPQEAPPFPRDELPSSGPDEARSG